MGDFDDSLGIEALIANDMSPNHFYDFGIGAKQSVEEVGVVRGVAFDGAGNIQGSMGIAVADLDRDQRLDFYVTNFQREYNTYYRQSRSGGWEDQTIPFQLAQTTIPLVGFGTQAADLDHDGFAELVVTNGHIDYPAPGVEPDYFQPFQIFRAISTKQFQLWADENCTGYLASKHVGRALWTLDANRDGLVDLAVTHQTEPVALLVNHSAKTHAWLHLSLIGTSSSRDAVGARVKVFSSTQSWVSSVVAGDGYLCSNERVLRFGLGSQSDQARLSAEVTWPAGRKEVFHDLSPKTEWLLIEEAGGFQLH